MSGGDRYRFGGGVKLVESCHLLPSNKVIPCPVPLCLPLGGVACWQWPYAPPPRPSQPLLAD